VSEKNKPKKKLKIIIHLFWVKLRVETQKKKKDMVRNVFLNTRAASIKIVNGPYENLTRDKVIALGHIQLNYSLPLENVHWFTSASPNAVTSLGSCHVTQSF
jgi:hypothetical protein